MAPPKTETLARNVTLLQPSDSDWRFRLTAGAADRDAVRSIVECTGFFRPDEIEVAVELVDERLNRGAASGYCFVFAEINDRVVGYACYGPIACTLASFDLYWIAVDPDFQGQGLGRALLQAIESQIAIADGQPRSISIPLANRNTPRLAVSTNATVFAAKRGW